MKLSHVTISLALLLGVYFSGPVVQFPKMDFEPPELGTVPSSKDGAGNDGTSAPVPQRPELLDAWLQRKEARFAKLKKDNEKTIVWASEKKTKTPWAIVYVHGFSASRLETDPLTQLVAQSLHANVFYTRLTGHGLEPQDLGEATPNDWIKDYIEAVKVGEQLGERVLVISCSTGSTLAALSPMLKITTAPEAHVFISPNFGPKDKRSEILLAPWGESIANWIEGPTHHTAGSGAQESLGWYQAYPTRSLFAMMYLVKLARESHLENFTAPLLVLYSERDQVVDVGAIKAAFQAIGSTSKQLRAIDYSDSENQHVLAGQIKAPKALPALSQEIIQWVKRLESSQGLR